MNDMQEYDDRFLTREYIGEPCTECEVEITKSNCNQDGLCISCAVEALQDHCS